MWSVTSANLYTLLDFPIKSLQFRQNNGALQCIHATADADTSVPIAFALSVHPDFPACRREGIITGENRSAVPITTQRLAGEEACAANATQIAGASFRPL